MLVRHIKPGMIYAKQEWDGPIACEILTIDRLGDAQWLVEYKRSDNGRTVKVVWFGAWDMPTTEAQ